MARALNFDNPAEMDPPVMPVFSSSPVIQSKKRQRKKIVPIVQPEDRRFTRSCLKTDGLQSKPVINSVVRSKKKPRAKLWLSPAIQGQPGEQGNLGSEDDGASTSRPVPQTPIVVIQ